MTRNICVFAEVEWFPKSILGKYRKQWMQVWPAKSFLGESRVPVGKGLKVGGTEGSNSAFVKATS